MDYKKDILNRLIDMYERRNAFDKDISILRSIQLDIKKTYPTYTDRYNHNTYIDINVAIDTLCNNHLINAEKSDSGQYLKVKLNVNCVNDVYAVLKRTSIPLQCNNVKKVLDKYQNYNHVLIQNIINDWYVLINDHKKLPYDLKYDHNRVNDVLNILVNILNLNNETYIRNFSTALFKDSKIFQKQFENTIKSILFDYTDEVVEKDQILEFYNLYENPTYVWIKGCTIIDFNDSVIDLSKMKDGIALSNASLDNIEKIIIKVNKLITVENLTTYHDCDDVDAVRLYLGGFHNHSKQKLLEKIYKDNKNCKYYHKGDLDVYGFLILENLIEKTNIPFKPLLMDIETINKFYQKGIYKTLSKTDIKVINEKIDNKLSMYKDVLEFMLNKNCKVEQESIKAIELIK